MAEKKAHDKTEKAEKPEKAEKIEKSQVDFTTDEKGELVAALHDCDLGMANLVVEKLMEDKSVGFAAVDYAHPTQRTPVLRVKGKNPKKSVANAIDAALKEFSSLKIGKR